MIHSDIRNFISELMRVGFQESAAEFKESAMQCLREIIPFDMALWASGRTDTLTVHNFYLHGLPPTLMESWEHIKHQDRLLASIVKSPGITYDVYDFYSREERQVLAVYQEHSRIFGIEAAISTAVPNHHTGLVEIMSLYRKSAVDSFSRLERETKQYVFPLMIDAWHGNQIQHMREKAGAARGAASAICDREGWLRHAEPRFLDLLNTEWNGWEGPAFPGPLCKWLGGKTLKPYKGANAVFLKNRLDDLVLLQAHPRGALALLTPREEEIAEAFSSGRTYKQIAQDLFVSPHTVRKHLESIYRKLEVSNKVELHQALGGR